MSLMWVSVTECSQSHIYHLTQMIKEDEDLRIILSSGTPYMDERGDGGLLTKDMERMLSLLGVPSHLKGYQYLKTAIDLCVQSTEELDGVTKRLYPDIARVYRSSAQTVEHAIRHAIKTAWERGDEKAQKMLFGCSRTESRRPTNSEFIARLTAYFTDRGEKYLS